MKRSTPSSNPLCEEKQTLRARKLGEIERLADEYIRESDEAILNRLLGRCELENAKTVFLYYSVGREVATVSLIERIIQKGKRAALPVSEDNGIMEFYLIDDLLQLQRGRFGIPEPPVTQPVRPEKGDVIIVPALCCDKFGHRLGRGAGYYDRYLAGVKCFSICLCRKVLLEDKLPAENTDIAVSLVLTD